MELATFGAGCFWGVEDTFRKLNGVEMITVGYLGGEAKNASYEEVGTGNTGHAEVVQIKYDSLKINYSELLNTFWKMHDPTSLNKQGIDIGSQYRSTIFYHSHLQKVIAEKSKNELQESELFDRPIITEITKASAFYRAEEFHQQYLKKNGLRTCHI